MRLSRSSPILSLLLLMANPAWAYRPYDSTDADVAEDDEVELELGWEELDLVGVPTDGIRAVFNIGLGRDRELVLEGSWLRAQASVGDTGSSITGVGAFLKQVHRRGALQGESGLSLASECGALIPTRSEEAGLGGECLLVASHEVSALAIHINASVAYETDHRWSRSAGLIIEAAGERRLKPGIEVVYERSEASRSELSALAGMSWSMSEACAFDVAYRWGLEPSTDLREWRLGLTWTH
jgi:hypothetical protein